MNLKSILIPVVLLATGLVLGCSASSPKNSSSRQGAASPQAVVDELKDAAAKNDIAGIVNLLAPQDRPLMSFGMLIAGEMIVGMMEAFDGDKAATYKPRLEALLKHHGLPSTAEQEKMGELVKKPKNPKEAQAMARKLIGDIDHAAFCTDMQGFLDDLSEGDEGSTNGLSLDVKTLRLSELVMDGDRARGKLGDKDVEFVRLDGGWFLHADPSTLR